MDGAPVSARELARRGAELARGRKHAPAAQLPPIGPPPAAELLLIGALIWPRLDSDPDPVLAVVLDDDIADPAIAALVKVIRAMRADGQPISPVLVLDELQRRGGPRSPVGDRLLQATTAGAVPEVLSGYARAVVAASLRRRTESVGRALTEAAGSMHEDDLAPMAQRAAASIATCAARLEKLRGGEG
jgi:replicative DNA helicase